MAIAPRISLAPILKPETRIQALANKSKKAELRNDKAKYAFNRQNLLGRAKLVRATEAFGGRVHVNAHNPEDKEQKKPNPNLVVS